MLQVKCGGIMLHRLADVTNVKYSRRWDPTNKTWSGPLMASWIWDADMSVMPSFLRRGAAVEITEGGHVVWGGFVVSAEREDGFRVVASGWGSLLSDYYSMNEHEFADDFPGAVKPEFNMETGFAYAQTNYGMPLTAVGTLQYLGLDDIDQMASDPDVEPVTLMQGLAMQANFAGSVVHVDEWGQVRIPDSGDENPAGPKDIYGPKPVLGIDPDVRPRMGAADPDYYSHLFAWAHFDLNGIPGGATTYMAFEAGDENAAEKWGRRQAWIDYRKWGTLSPDLGLSILFEDLGRRFQDVGARLQFMDRITVDDQCLRRLGCGPTTATDVLEGEVVRAFGAADADGNALLGAYEEFTVGEVEYDDTTKQAVLTPVGFTPRDLFGILADPTEARTGPGFVPALDTVPGIGGSGGGGGGEP